MFGRPVLVLASSLALALLPVRDVFVTNTFLKRLPGSPPARTQYTTVQHSTTTEMGGVRNEQGMRTARDVCDNAAKEVCDNQAHAPAQAAGTGGIKQVPSSGGLARPTPRLYGREQACRLKHLEVLHANGCTRQLKLKSAKKQTACNGHTTYQAMHTRRIIISCHQDTREKSGGAAPWGTRGTGGAVAQGTEACKTIAGGNHRAGLHSRRAA